MHPPVSGQPLHTRSLTTRIRLADDGRWHVRGTVIDIRKTGFAAMPMSLQPAGLIHDMTIDLSLEPETLRIESLETHQPVVAIEPSAGTRGECCRDPASALQGVVGERIDPGFSKKLSLVFGGPRGCSHLLALFFFMAAAVTRGAELEHERSGIRGSDRATGEMIFCRSLALDGLLGATGDVELSVEVGDYLLSPERLTRRPVDRLEDEHDIRIHGVVRPSDQVLLSLRAAERARDHQSLAAAEWQDRSEWAGALAGAPLLSGFAARVLQMGGATPHPRLLTDALLQLAPGHFQVLAAFADQWAASPTGGEADGDGASSLGMRANCYMWRPDGALGPL